MKYLTNISRQHGRIRFLLKENFLSTLLFFFVSIMLPATALCESSGEPSTTTRNSSNESRTSPEARGKDNEYWKSKLSPAAYRICRESGTEKPFSGSLLHDNSPGDYRCSSCDQLLFSSEDKFDSGSGWPSFSKVVIPEAVTLRPDTSHRIQRTEVLCSQCGAHLGHLFDDGPKPSGQRFCVNSVCLKKEPRK